jgi:hypothetical protein
MIITTNRIKPKIWHVQSQSKVWEEMYSQWLKSLADWFITVIFSSCDNIWMLTRISVQAHIKQWMAHQLRNSDLILIHCNCYRKHLILPCWDLRTGLNMALCTVIQVLQKWHKIFLHLYLPVSLVRMQVRYVDKLPVIPDIVNCFILKSHQTQAGCWNCMTGYHQKT